MLIGNRLPAASKKQTSGGLPGRHCATHVTTPCIRFSAATRLAPGRLAPRTFRFAAGDPPSHTSRPAFCSSRTLLLAARTLSPPPRGQDTAAATIHPPPPGQYAAGGAPAPQPPSAGEKGAPRLAAVTAYTQPVTRPPPSPGAQASPSTMDASPQRTPGPTRVRASVACQKCRASKTKCNNDADGEPCKACQAKNLVCTYGESTGPSTGGGLPRRESTADGEVSAVNLYNLLLPSSMPDVVRWTRITPFPPLPRTLLSKDTCKPSMSCIIDHVVTCPHPYATTPPTVLLTAWPHLFISSIFARSGRQAHLRPAC